MNLEFAVLASLACFSLVQCARNFSRPRGTSRYLEQESSVYDEAYLANFTYTFHNSTGLRSGASSEATQVDCFGLGTTVARALAWFFASKPNGTNALDVKFYMSSSRQPRRVKVLIGDQFGLEWTDFKMDRRTVVIVHGFLSHGGESWVYELEAAFLRWSNVNVIVVDWSAGGNTWNYYKAAVNTKIVGYQIAKLLDHIANDTVSRGQTHPRNWGPLHFVGHSLGAHICGFAAKELKKRRTDWHIHRITGLDPAQPCFRNADASVHLHKTDAQFVDIIHTNGRLLSKIGLGLPEPLGHLDFYPNGGKRQPGCIKPDYSFYSYLPIPQTMIRQAICSHGRSYVYLTESLISASANNCSFWAHHWDLTYGGAIRVVSQPCNDNECTEMGIKAEIYPRQGTFFAATGSYPPFCVNGTELAEEVKTNLEVDFYDLQNLTAGNK